MGWGGEEGRGGLIHSEELKTEELIVSDEGKLPVCNRYCMCLAGDLYK